MRALDHQRAMLTELRGRAGMLLATASITVSLLGQDAFHGMRMLALFAVVCFALLSVSVIAIVWPHAEWNFDVDPRALLAPELSADQPPLIDLPVELIAHLVRQRRANGEQLVRIARVFRIGACLLAIQIVLTVAAASAIV